MKVAQFNRWIHAAPLALAAFLLASCGGGDGGYETSLDEFDAKLRVPNQEVPDGFELTDVKLRIVDGTLNAGASQGSSRTSTEDFPADELLAEIDLQPSGLTFSPPAELQLSLPVSGDGALYEFQLVSGDLEEAAAVKSTQFSDDRSHVVVTVEIAHFSKLRLRRSQWYGGAANKFYQVDVRAPIRANVGQSFTAYAEVRRRNDVTVWFRDVLENGTETNP